MLIAVPLAKGQITCVKIVELTTKSHNTENLSRWAKSLVITLSIYGFKRNRKVFLDVRFFKWVSTPLLSLTSSKGYHLGDP